MEATPFILYAMYFLLITAGAGILYLVGWQRFTFQSSCTFWRASEEGDSRWCYVALPAERRPWPS